MPKNNNRNVQDFSHYDAMSSDDLAQLLRLDSEAPEGKELDIDTLLYITGVLAEREKTSRTGKTAQEAWDSFQQNYLYEEETPVPAIQEFKPQKQHHPWLRRAIVAVAVMALVVCIPMSAKALNWEKIWTAVATWAAETFSFVREDQPEVDDPETQNDRQFDSLQQAFAQAGLEVNFIPTWIPDGFGLDMIDVDETPVQRNYIALYIKDEQHLNICVRSYVENDPERVEINENLVEVYTVAGVEYYIFSNQDWIRAVWILDSYECSVSGEITIEEIKEMIDSIPKG